MFVFWYKDTFIRLRFNVTAILGEILVLAAIVVGFVRIFACGYTDEPILPILATASCIYLLNRYVYYPLCIRNLGDGRALHLPPVMLPGSDDSAHFTARTRISSVMGHLNVVYRFWHLFYLPLVPRECFVTQVKKKGKYHNTSKSYTIIHGWRTDWHWREVVYIYLKCWSRFIVVALALMTLMF